MTRECAKIGYVRVNLFAFVTLFARGEVNLLGLTETFDLGNFMEVKKQFRVILLFFLILSRFRVHTECYTYLKGSR